MNCGRVGIAAVILIMGVAPSAFGQGVSFRLSRGQIGVMADGQWSTYQFQGQGTRNTFREWVAVGGEGHLLHPRFLSFQLGIRPTLQQYESSGLLEGPTRRGRSIAWHVNAELLRSRPLSFMVSSTRDDDVLENRFGFERRFNITNTFARLVYANRYLPVTVLYTLRHRRRAGDLTATDPDAASNISADVRVRRLDVQAKNRKTQLIFRKYVQDDRITLTEIDRTDAFFKHRLAWGKGSTLRTEFDYQRYTGSVNLKQVAWREFAHLQHSWNVSSEYGVQLRQFTDNGVDGSEARLLALVNARLGGNTRSITQGQWRRLQVGAGNTRSLRVGQHFVTSLPLGAATVDLGGGLDYNKYATEPASGDGWLTVADEAHVVPPSARVTLSNTYVDEASVRIRVSEGPFLQVDVDYQLFNVPPFTDVLVLPSGQVGIGDTVLVSYRYRPFVNDVLSSIVFSLDGAVQFWGMRLYGRLVRTELPEQATGTLSRPGTIRLDDFDQSTVGARFQEVFSVFLVDLVGEWRKRSGAEYFQQETETRGIVTFTPLGALSLSIGGTGLWGDGSSGEFEVFSAHTTATWVPIPTLILNTELRLWQRTLNGVPDDFLGGELSARWTPGLTEVIVRVARSRWADGEVQYLNYLNAYVSRSF